MSFINYAYKQHKFQLGQASPSEAKKFDLIKILDLKAAIFI